MNMRVLTLNKPNITNFSSERNKLMESVDDQWILFLDKDESISNSQFPISNQFSSYQFSRKNFFLGKYIGNDILIRLVKKGTGKWVRAVHEVWEPNNSHLVGVVKNNFIIHNTSDNLSDYLNKINNYSTLHAKANFDEGKKATLFKIIFYPIFKFVVTLVKSKNIVFSIMQSLHSYLSWTKLYLQQY
jgi:hypothetical protein